MTPYGYRIVEGEAVVDQNEGENIKKLFLLYYNGSTIKTSAAESGIPYSIAQRALSNLIYLGTEFYPKIIDDELFEKVQKKRAKRNRYKPGRNMRRNHPIQIKRKFRLSPRIFSKRIPAGESMAGWIYQHIIKGKEEKMNDDMKEAVFHFVQKHMGRDIE